MSTLTKNVLPPDPGSPGVPDTPGYYAPGVPPTSAHPAYCIDESTYYPQTYGYITGFDKDGNFFMIPYSTGPKTVTEQHCYPATAGTPGVPGPWVPGVPGIPAIPPTPADYQIGWNASARSIGSLTGDGQYKFSVPADSVGVVTGLNDVDNGSNYIEIDYAIYCATGQFQILEGVVPVGITGNYSVADVFAIARVSTQVRYFKNSTLLYTSLVPCTSSNMFADSSLYFGGDKILNASLATTVDTGFAATTGSLAGTLTGYRGYFVDSVVGNGGNVFPGVPPPIGSGGNPVVTGTGDWEGRSGDDLRMMVCDFHQDASLDGYFGGTLSGMFCFLADNDVDEVRGVLPGLTGVWAGDGGIYALLGILPSMEGELVTSDVPGSLEGRLGGLSGYVESGLLIPSYAAAAIAFDTMVSFMAALAGMSAQLTGVLGGLRGFASNAPNGGYTQPGTPPVPSDPVDPTTGDWVGRSGDQLRMLIGFFVDQAAINLGTAASTGLVELPHPLLVDGHAIAAGMLVGDVVLPHPLTTDAAFGWQVDAVLSQLTLDAGMTVPNILRADITLPTMQAFGTGTVGTIFGTPDDSPLLLPLLGVQGKVSGENDSQITLPVLQVDGRITTDISLAVQIQLPRLGVAGSIFSIDPQNPLGRTLQGHVVLPALRMDSNALEGDLQLPALWASGYVPTLGGAAVETRIGYAMNLKTGAVTEFSNFPFRAMGRAYNMYWGVGLDGNLYQMGGDKDDTAPIDWEWQSGHADFGLPGLKGVLAVYIRAVFENGATLMFHTDDDATREYDHVAAGDYRNHKVHRIPLGRGVRTDNMAFGMANPQGGYLELDKVTPEYVIIPRNL